MKIYFEFRKSDILYLTRGGRLCKLPFLSGSGVKHEKSEAKAWVCGQNTDFYHVQFFWRPRPAPIKISTTTDVFKVEVLWRIKVFYDCVHR
jgi:hypothetical protein